MIKLPRLNGNLSIVDFKTGRSVSLFSKYWDALATQIENLLLVPTGPIASMSYTVAALPTPSAGLIAYASNGRKNGEGAGLGTGVMVFADASAWRACDTGATVAA